MSKKKKRPPLNRPTVRVVSDESSIFVYFLINESPTYIYSRAYSEVYDLLQSLFGEDPIPESEALEALTAAGLQSPKEILRWMTIHKYLHKADLEEVLK